MSIDPHRNSYGFSTIPSTPNNLPRQHMMNSPAFQQAMTLVPSTSTSLTTQNSNSNNTGSNSPAIARNSGTGGNTQTLYCDNCQTFRHISFFQDKSFKYNVCRLCDEREMQKRMVNKERYEQYEEQQKNLKHNRYPISQPQNTYTHAASSSYTPNQTPSIFTGAINGATNSPPQTSTQLTVQLPQMPITLGGNNLASLPPPSNLSTPGSSHPSPQLNGSPSIMLGMNKPHLFSTTAPSMTANNNGIQGDQLLMQPISQPPLSLSNPTPRRTKSANKAGSGSNSSASSAHVELMSLYEFVEELKKHAGFDRKLYHLDITPLIEELGPSAGFSQLGRGICEKVLEGTKFNFSLKDRRKSTKNPDTLSTLRYYCSQRIDTAKPRKAEHPKAQLKYDCAGALTIIIDLAKKSAHVTVIHKHAHPPFLSNHSPKSQLVQRVQARSIQHSQQNYQQQQPQEQMQEQLQVRIMKQKQDQINKRFDTLKHQLEQVGQLLESQRHYANEEFLNVATEALSDASEMVQACNAVDNSDVIYPPNKYTLHYNKKEIPSSFKSYQ